MLKPYGKREEVIPNLEPLLIDLLENVKPKWGMDVCLYQVPPFIHVLTDQPRPNSSRNPKQEIRQLADF